MELLLISCFRNPVERQLKVAPFVCGIHVERPCIALCKIGFFIG
jgi:hypothetical protein